MEKKVIGFLDIDGVLNDHSFNEKSICCSIDKTRVDIFNRIFELGIPIEFVISSAWRYMILGKAMTYEGFSYMMYTHGIDRRFHLMGITDSDEETIRQHNLEPGQLYERTTVRDLQIADFIERYDGTVPNKNLYVAIDDLPLSVPKKCGFIKTDGLVGFTEDNYRSFVDLVGLAKRKWRI